MGESEVAQRVAKGSSKREKFSRLILFEFAMLHVPKDFTKIVKPSVVAVSQRFFKIKHC